MPQFYGQVSTSLGDGIVYERITNADQRSALGIAEAVCIGQLTVDAARTQLEQRRLFLHQHWVVFADVGIDNVVWQQ